MPESYTGDEGVEAQAAGLDVMDGGEKVRGTNGGWRGINKTRDMIAALRTWVTTQLGSYLLTSEAAAAGVIAANKLVRYKANTRVPVSSPIAAEDAANKLYVDGAVSGIDLSSRVAKTGDTMTGHLYLPNSIPANIGTWTAAYINGDGRVSRGASSARYKDDITPVDPATLGDLFPQLHSFVMKGDPGRVRRVGYIAEHLAANPATEPFVVYERTVETDDAGNVTGSHLTRDEHGSPIPDAIDPITLLLAQVAQLHARIAELESKR